MGNALFIAGPSSSLPPFAGGLAWHDLPLLLRRPLHEHNHADGRDESDPG
jgi:hypothetical protein